MKECALSALFWGSKVAIVYLAYLSAKERVPHCGWLVFAAVFYVCFFGLKVD